MARTYYAWAPAWLCHSSQCRAGGKEMSNTFKNTPKKGKVGLDCNIKTFVKVRVPVLSSWDQYRRTGNSYLNKLHNSIRHGGLAEFLQILHYVRGLQPHTDSSIQWICCEFVLVDVVGPAHRLRNGHQEILCILINWWKRFEKDVSIWSLQEAK